MYVLTFIVIVWLLGGVYIYYAEKFEKKVSAHPVVKTEWNTPVPRQLKPCRKRTQCPDAKTCYAEVPCSHPEKLNKEVID